MNLNKRFFLITACVMAIFAAIAMGPVYKRTVTPVRAAPMLPIPAVAIINCTAVNSSEGVLGQPVVDNVDFSLGLVIPPAFFALYQTGSNCAEALQGLAVEGFERQESAAASITNATFPYGALINTWTYVLPDEALLTH